MDSNAPAEVGRFINVVQAEFARSVLEGSGIPAFLDQPFIGGIAPHYMLGSGGVRLFVADCDKERALQLLGTLDESETE